MKVRCGIGFVLALAAALWGAGPPGAGRADEPGADAARPSARSPRAEAYLSRRVVHVFDFEERDENNFERLPRYWYAIGGPGFPSHTADLTGFDDAQHVSGRHAFRLKLDGGSAAAVLEHGAIAAVPGADYLVSAQVRTADVEHSRARMVAYFVDQHGRRIEASTAMSPLTETNGKWRRIEARLSGDFDQAAWIVLRLELLQADEFRRSTLGRHEVYMQDIGAAAWFDDVSVFQLPRIEIASQTPTNVIRRPARPQLHITVRDQTGEQLTASVQVYDDLGRPVDRQMRLFAGRQSPTWQWQPDLPRLGWYWADLMVRGEKGMVGRRAVAFAWLPQRRPIDPPQADRFGLVAERLPEAERAMLRPMLEVIGCNSVILDIWRGDRTITLTSDQTMPDDPLVDALLADGRSVTLSLAKAPTVAAQAANTDANLPLALLAGDPAAWQPHLRPLAVGYAQTVPRWQIGRVGSDEACWRSDLPVLYPRLRQWLGQIVPDAVVALPWSAEFDLPAGLADIEALTLTIPRSVRPPHVLAYLQSVGVPADRISVAIETLDPARYDHAERVADLALRMIEAARADPRAILIHCPWNAGDGRREPTATPDPLLAVFANMIDRLAGRRIVGQIDLAEGVRCYILDGAAGGALVAWNESSSQPDVPLDLYLGAQPVAVDVWGNAVPIGRRDGKHQLTIGRLPVFVEGIDARLAKFRSLLRFDPPFIESSYKLHELDLVVANTWSAPVSGKLLLDGIDRWTIKPRHFDFTVPAGQETRIPISLNFPISELAGVKQIAGHMVLDADGVYELDVTIPLTIGIRDIEFNPSVSVDPDTGDLIVTALVTNRTDRPRSFFAFVIAGDLAHQQRIIAQLQPDQTAMKRFRLPGVRGPLAGKSIRAGLRDMDGPAMVNQLLDVP